MNRANNIESIQKSWLKKREKGRGGARIINKKVPIFVGMIHSFRMKDKSVNFVFVASGPCVYLSARIVFPL